MGKKSMKIIDLFFPRQVKCVFCGKETREFGICDECYSHLPFIMSAVCDKCGGRNSGKGKVCGECKNRHLIFKKCYSVLDNTANIREKIISFKQSGNKYLGETFAHLIENKYNEINEEIDLIIPMPISADRLKIRSYNQSEILCKYLPKEKLATDVVVRIQDTPHQTGLSRANREENLSGAFRVNDKKKIKNKTILIVDDIYTTGSTLNECARTLLSSGSGQVFGLCLARTPVKIDRIVK